jgi:heme/copper-type cytochrome/quinol oxidase subunit 4
VYFLSFLLVIALSVLSFGHCIVCPFPKERTNNAMANRKDKQYNDQKKGQTIQWPKERTDNTMTKRKDRQYNGPVYCLSFLLVIVLSVLSFGQCIFCPFFWSLYCLSFLLVIVLSVLSFGHCIVCPLKERTDNTMAKRKDKQYNGQKKGQTIQ